MYNNSSLPKLLAKENITIRHGNYRTPWFDIKNRVLGLPLWKDMGKDIYDLFVGHEVGHALATPYEGWHDSPEKLQGCPRSYINVIEDARIERVIKSTYPGLVGPFSRAYSKLFDDNFFGTDDLDITELRIIDKINLQAKVGSHVIIEFNDEEQVFMDRAMLTEDFPEVLQLVKDIVAYDKANEEEEEEKPDNAPDEQDTQDEDQEGDIPSSNDDSDESSEQDGDAPSPTIDDEDDEDISSSSNGHDGEVSLTDDAFRKNEESLLDIDEDTGMQILTVSDINKEVMKKIIVDYKDLKLERDSKVQHLHEEQVEELSNANLAYPAYIKNVKRSVGVAVKEFEMRKAATQWAKATTAKTGVIDVNKLFSYKTNEDIFKQTTRLHDAQSHGMIMLIDYSGSMYDSLPKVLEQLIHLVLFCKQVNIPFDVYAFTTGNRKLNTYDLKDQGLLFDGDLDLDDLSMPLLTSSKLKKSDFEESLRAIHARATMSTWSSRSMIGKSEEFGSTPLHQALVVATHLIKAFKTKHQIEKMNLVVFSDGDSNNLQAFSDSSISDNKIQNRGSYRGVNLMVDGKLLTSPNNRKVVKTLLENIRSRYNTSCIGFFMADDNRAFNFKIDEIEDAYRSASRSEAAKEYRKNKCVVKKDALGYTEFYLVKGGNNLSTDDDEFGVSSDQTKNQMATAFKKYSKSKKQNKILMTTFGRIVA